MSAKLTEAQMRVLDRLANPPPHRKHGLYSREALGTNARLLEKLEKAGLTHSLGPFASVYHTVSITDAGRNALHLAREGDSNG